MAAKWLSIRKLTSSTYYGMSAFTAHSDRVMATLVWIYKPDPIKPVYLDLWLPRIERLPWNSSPRTAEGQRMTTMANSFGPALTRIGSQPDWHAAEFLKDILTVRARTPAAHGCSIRFRHPSDERSLLGGNIAIETRHSG